jgi:hypothetical protein
VPVGCHEKMLLIPENQFLQHWKSMNFAAKKRIYNGGSSISHRIMVLLYMVTFTINIPQMLAYIPYMDPMGI